MVHKPIQAYKKIKKAKDAVDEEWEKLEGKRERKNGKKSIAWDVKAVKPRAEVEQRARDEGIVVHFGELMALCHLKNAELAEFLQRYKGRIVFRGDGVKDAEGFYAVFTEQGASASHMSATKFVDAVSHFPGNTGEDSDAIGAYTQIPLADAARLLGIGVLPETWIKLPKDRQPKEWEGIEDPVCPLLQNLYGHPLAGLLWEKGCHEKLIAEGFERLQGWESLYVHREMKLFLNIYVDDFHMAGKKESMQPMWERLGKHLDLEDAVPFDGHVYLGCEQRDIEPNAELVFEKTQLFQQIMKTKTGPKGNAMDEQGEATKQFTEQFAEKHKSKSSTRKQRKQRHASAASNAAAAEHCKQTMKNVKAWEYRMIGSAEATVDRYLELSKLKITSLKKVSTPCIDDHLLAP
ncbi:MAG: hypothetical protein QGH82_07675, partial [Candidatus Woesearchaeota archaeon]|nr:hypothetical protein [Candidatus Woesearchaeota archaeon]